MIISRTPLRISFVGGGSDLQSFYKNSYGAVVSTTIDKYIYITVNKKFDGKIRASYSKTEIVDKVEELEHELIRESLKSTHITGGIEITSISDIPSSGSGLGSSSSYTVGLLNALNAYKGKISYPGYLAKEACLIEINKCSQHIGKQDQYAAAYGGFNYIRFNPDGTVFIEPIVVKHETRNLLESNLLMFYTGITRSASKILKNQEINIINKSDLNSALCEMVKLTDAMRTALSEGKVDEVGYLLDINWKLKKQMSEEISNTQIDKWYETARKNGALGGKVLGAGGGGFLLFYAPSKHKQKVISSLNELKLTPFKFEPYGSKLIFIE